MQYLEIAIRCLVGAVFLASSVTKVAGRGAFDRFVTSVRDLRLVRANRARPVARCVVVVEFAVWLLLALPTPGTATAGFLTACGLLLVFDLGIWLAVRHGARTTCRCFGASAAPLGRRHLVRNLILVLIGVLGAAGTLWNSGPLELAGVAVAVPGGLVAGGVFVELDELLELFRPAGAGTGTRPHPPTLPEETRDALPGFGAAAGGGGLPAEPDRHDRRDQTAARAC